VRRSASKRWAGAVAVFDRLGFFWIGRNWRLQASNILGSFVNDEGSRMALLGPRVSARVTAEGCSNVANGVSTK
jgi:hypothetical protein